MNITHYYTLLSCDGLIVSYDPIKTIDEDICRKTYVIDDKALDAFMNETFGDYDIRWECNGITTSCFEYGDEYGRISETLFLSRDLQTMIESADIDGNVTNAQLFEELKNLKRLKFEDSANIDTTDLKIHELCLGAAIDRPGVHWIAEAAMQF